MNQSVTTVALIPLHATKEVLVELYKTASLRNSQLCHRWKEETLRRKLLEAGFSEEVIYEPEPEPEPEPVPESKPEPEPEPEPEPQPPAPSLSIEEVEHKLILAMAQKIPAGERAPMNHGLALIPAGSFLGSSAATFTPDTGARWVSLQYVSPGHFRDYPLRDRYLASVRQTTFRYGIPELSPRSVTRQYDFSLPLSAAPKGEELSLDDRQLVRTCNALGWAVLSTAIRCRRVWHPFREAFLDFLEAQVIDLPCRRKMQGFISRFISKNGRPPTLEEKLSNIVVLGGDRTYSGSVLRLQSWFPVPHLGFPSHRRDELWDACTRQATENGGVTHVLPEAALVHMADEVARSGRGIPFAVPFRGVYDTIEQVRSGGRSHYLHWFRTPQGLWRHLRSTNKLELLAEPGTEVEVGQVIGYEPLETPNGFRSMHPGRKSRELRRNFCRSDLLLLLEDWFNRQLWEVTPGRIHVATHLAGVIADQANPAALLWRVNQCRRFWDDASESYVFPTFAEYPLLSYNCTIQAPTCEVQLDLTPADERLWFASCRWLGSTGERSSRRLQQELLKDLRWEYHEFRAQQIKEERKELRARLVRARWVAAECKQRKAATAKL